MISAVLMKDENNNSTYQHTFLFDRAWFVLIPNWKRENEIGSMHPIIIIITPDICQDIFQLKRRNVEKKLTPRPILGKIGSVAQNVEHFPLKPKSSYPPFMPKRSFSATIVQSVLKDHVMTHTGQNQCRFQIDKKLLSFELNIENKKIIIISSIGRVTLEGLWRRCCLSSTGLKCFSGKCCWC